jgi:hypothetical protein
VRHHRFNWPIRLRERGDSRPIVGAAQMTAEAADVASLFVMHSQPSRGRLAVVGGLICAKME